MRLIAMWQSALRGSIGRLSQLENENFRLTHMPLPIYTDLGHGF